MPVLTIAYRDEAERLGLEQAIAYFMQMRQTAQTAPDGTVLAVCEQVALNERTDPCGPTGSRRPRCPETGSGRGKEPFRAAGLTRRCSGPEAALLAIEHVGMK
jgi:hypothetical protein